MARILTDVLEREAFEDALDPIPDDDLPATDIDDDPDDDLGDPLDADDPEDDFDALDPAAHLGDLDGFEVDPDGEPLPDDVQAEIEALAAEGLAGRDARDEEREAERQVEVERARGLQAALAAAQQELERQRGLACAAVARYREAVLANEPDLPPELVRGDSIEDVDASIAAARTMVARVRERVEARRPTERGFPAGAPARETSARGHLTARQKIAAGLQERMI